MLGWALARVSPEKMDDWLRDLHDLLPWQTTASAAAEQIESESFLAMMAKGGG